MIIIIMIWSLEFGKIWNFNLASVALFVQNIADLCCLKQSYLSIMHSTKKHVYACMFTEREGRSIISHPFTLDKFMLFVLNKWLQ